MLRSILVCHPELAAARVRPLCLPRLQRTAVRHSLCESWTLAHLILPASLDPLALMSATAAAAPCATATAVAASPAAPCPDRDLALVRSLITAHRDFPSPGILFQDVFPVFRNPKAMRMLLTRMTAVLQRSYTDIDVIVGLDSRGFLFGPTLAMQLDAAFVPIRKVGKLPGDCAQTTYTTEYSKAVSEIQRGSIQSGQRVVIVDDLLATGGTLASSINLVRELGGLVVACIVVIELDECRGRQLLVEKCGLRSDDIHATLNY